jgi:nucleotide-binding universal stress UspA family protein
LDGSRLAECVLPHVQALGTSYKPEEVILASVTERKVGYRAVEDPDEPTRERLVPEGFGKLEKQAQRYLDRIAKQLETKGIKVRTKILLGNPAEEISFYAEDQRCDLVIMASHGRSGLSRWSHGSVTDKVLRAACVPILIVRPPGCKRGV